jgi:hypothetical protein
MLEPLLAACSVQAAKASAGVLLADYLMVQRGALNMDSGHAGTGLIGLLDRKDAKSQRRIFENGSFNVI